MCLTSIGRSHTESRTGYIVASTTLSNSEVSPSRYVSESLSAQAHATTAAPGFQPGGSLQSQAAASRADLFSPALISILQMKIR